MKQWIESRLSILKDKRIWIILIAAFLMAGLTLHTEDGGMTQEEKRIARMLSRIQGAGSVQVSIYYAQEASAFGGGAQMPVGAVAVSEGAGSIGVKMKLTEALRTLLGLNARQVTVLEMEEER